jgi:hypothetical protein
MRTIATGSKYWPKEVITVETSFPFTSRTGNGFETIFGGNASSSPQGQADDNWNAINRTHLLPVAPANAIGVEPGKRMGTGVFYFGAAGLALNNEEFPVEVGPANTKAGLRRAHWGGSGTTFTEPFTPNANYRRLYDAWNKYGVGWASRYSSYYARTTSGTNGTTAGNFDEGHHHGGAPKDNVAFHDFWGFPLPSMTIWRDVYTGAGPPVQIGTISILPGAELPATVQFDFTDGTPRSFVPVAWNAEDVARMNAGGSGVHSVRGDIESSFQSYTVIVSVTVSGANLVTNPQFVSNVNGWTFSTSGASGFQRNATGGRTNPTGSLEKRNNNANEWMRQTINNVPAGYYEFSMWIMGDTASTVSLVVNGETVNLNRVGTVYGELDGAQDEQHPR